MDDRPLTPLELTVLRLLAIAHRRLDERGIPRTTLPPA